MAFGRARTIVERLSGSNVSEPSFGNFVKSLTQRSEDRGLACVLFPASDRDIDVLRVKLDRSRASTCLFSSDQGRATATKGIEHETASLGAIFDRIDHHRDRLHRRMHCQFVQAAGSHRIYTVCAVPAILAEFKGVQM